MLSNYKVCRHENDKWISGFKVQIAVIFWTRQQNWMAKAMVKSFMKDNPKLEEHEVESVLLLQSPPR